MDPRLDATAQADLVRSGEVTARELAEAAIERIEALNGELNAVIHPLFEEALASEPAAGPFQGVPFLIKDLACHMAGQPMHEGMSFLRDLNWVEPEDTWLARRFREAGFVSLGKTNTPELGILPTTEPVAYGPSRNPWDTEHSTGGSSGGSAAAVASGMVPIAHANDGGGSIRIPASCCGLVGLKPSRGRVSLSPDFGDVMSGLVSELVVSRSVRDAAAVLEWVSDPPPGEPYVAPARERDYNAEVGADPGRLRIGLLTRPPGGDFEAHPDCVAAAESAGRLLESLGHSVEIAYPEALDDPEYIPNFLVRWTGGVAWNIAYWERRTGRAIGADDVEPLTWALAEQGRTHSAADYLRAMEFAQAITRQQRRVVGERVRPAADADDGRAADAARDLRRAAGQSDRPDPDGRPRRGLHRGLQHDRSARDLAAAAPVRRRAADRRAAGRGLRARGRADPDRGPARAGAALGGPLPPVFAAA